jgi:hypothetical protein
LLFQALDAMMQFDDLLGEPELQFREPLPHFGAQGFNLGTQASYLGAHPERTASICALSMRVLIQAVSTTTIKLPNRARIAGIHNWTCAFMDAPILHPGRALRATWR